VEDAVIGYGGKGAENYLLIQDMAQLKRHAARLAKQLEKGDSRDATSKIFDRIQRQVRAIVDARKSSPLLGGSQDEIDQARAAYEKLADYYGVEPIPPPGKVSAPGR
jgi:hypothetical protein